MTIGPIRPNHRKGHCGYDPALDGSTECGAPATWHYLVRDAEHGEFVAYACDEHREHAERFLAPADRHPLSDRCPDTHPRMMWRYTVADRWGWCYVDDDEHDTTAAVAEVHELESVAR